MEINCIVIVTLVAYTFGAINKLFIPIIPNKYIPIQNVIIGFVSALICYFIEIESNLFSAIIVCLTATMGAGGISDLIQLRKDV